MNSKLNENMSINFNEYLIFLTNSKKYSLYASPKNAAIKYFFNCLNWRKITLEIEENIINNLLKIKRENN